MAAVISDRGLFRTHEDAALAVAGWNERILACAGTDTVRASVSNTEPCALISERLSVADKCYACHFGPLALCCRPFLGLCVHRRWC